MRPSVDMRDGSGRPSDLATVPDLGAEELNAETVLPFGGMRALSDELDPNHAKTLLNVGIVRAFGKQDLDGASQAWQQVIKLAPDSPEGQAAKRALDSLQSAHPALGGASKPSG